MDLLDYLNRPKEERMAAFFEEDENFDLEEEEQFLEELRLVATIYDDPAYDVE